ncbi:MAG TPA: twin-arginine translocase TatA/TatE family subunit [Candidatus Acidoferrales bacterium]|nr:twin-arginine translocase TatA/TatE family subunit [Candidatus Acidoferrales bacterium]
MLSIPHLIVIFVVALVVFGPEKLPELARGLGKIMAEFRRHTNDLRSTFEGHLRDLEREADARKIGGSLPAPALPTSPSPGTVPSNPPNAAALGVPSSETGSAASSPPSAGVRKHPGDDPYLADLTNGEFAPARAGDQAEPTEPGNAPQRVTDGDVRPA